MGKEIALDTTGTNLILQQLLQGNGDSVTTTTGGGIDPGAIEQIMQLIGGITGPTGGVSPVPVPTVPGVSPEITPDQLAALFTSGAQQVPNLTAAYANSVGARSSNNSGLQLALESLMGELTKQAGAMKQSQQALSTDAAYKGGQLANQANGINAGNEMGMLQLQMQAEFLKQQLAAQALMGQKAPTTKVTNKTGGIDPWVMLGGGMALNYADKKGWWDKLFNSEDTTDGATELGSISLPTQETPGLLPISGLTFGGDSNMFDLTGGIPMNWEMPSLAFDYSMPDLGGFDFSLGLDSIPDYSSVIDVADSTFDFGNIDFGNLFGDFSLDTVAGSEWDAGYFDFAHGGMPMRAAHKYADGGLPARNRNNMGAAPVKTVQGVQNREAPEQFRGLIAPIDMTGYKSQQEAWMEAVAEMRAAYEDKLRQRQEAIDAAIAARDEQIAARQNRPIAEIGDGNNKDMESRYGQSFDPNVAAAAKKAMQAIALAAAFTGSPLAAGYGITSNLAKAENNDDALAAAGKGAVRISEPLMGFITNQADSIRQARAKQEQEQAAKEQQQQQQQQQQAGDLPAGDSNWGAMTQETQQALDDANAFFNSLSRDTGNNSSGSVGGTNNSAGSGYGGSGPGDRALAADGGSFQRQGLVTGPGTGTSDSVPVPMAHLSNGEYINSADVVQAMGGPAFFDALQAAFHKGGAPK